MVWPPGVVPSALLVSSSVRQFMQDGVLPLTYMRQICLDYLGRNPTRA